MIVPPGANINLDVPPGLPRIPMRCCAVSILRSQVARCHRINFRLFGNRSSESALAHGNGTAIASPSQSTSSSLHQNLTCKDEN